MTATAPRIDIRFEEARHAYTLNGDPTISVTQILDAEGLAGSPFYTEAARKRGTAVHKIALLLSHNVRGGSPEEIIANSPWDPARTPNQALHGYGYACARFYHEQKIRPILVESLVASVKFRYCGTTDLYGEVPGGERWTVDYKSGKPEEAAFVQTALYDIAIQETHGLKTDKRVVVWLKPDGTYQIMLPKLAPSVYTNAGMCAVNLYRWRAQFKKLG